MEVVLSWPTQLIEFINAYPVRSQFAPLLLPPISRLTQFGGGAAAFAMPSSSSPSALEYALIARDREVLMVYGKQCHQLDEYGVGLIRRQAQGSRYGNCGGLCAYSEGATFSSYALIGYVYTLKSFLLVYFLCCFIFVEAFSRNWPKCLRRSSYVYVSRNCYHYLPTLGFNKISESSRHFVPILVATIDPS